MYQVGVVISMKPGLEDKMQQLVEQESAATAIEEWTNSLKDLTIPPFNYRGDHVVQVVNVAKQLAKETSANYDVVVMAAWLHDCAKPATEGEKGFPKHPEKSAVKAREFLLKEGVKEPIVDRVCDAIRKHGGYSLEETLEAIEPLEAQIVWEADKLTKLGLTTIIHLIINGVRYQPNNSMQGILKRVQEPMPIWRKIVASMRTEPGKRIAEYRIKNIEEFINSLEKELYFLE